MNRSQMTARTASACILLGAPLLGALLAGKTPGQYMEFPPLTRHVEHAPLNWTAFIVLAILELLMLLPILFQLTRQRIHPMAIPRAVFRIRARRFPWWGYISVAAMAVFWWVAWSRPAFLGALCDYSFQPLWFSYCFLVQALVFYRRGSCSMLRHPGRWMVLFPASAVFWWFFEYLNRFAQNWYYEGIEDYSATRYVIFASLAFSTVLPAVLGSCELLQTFSVAQRAFGQGPRIRCRHHQKNALITLCIATLGLIGIAKFPRVLFPLLWIAPLLIAGSTELISGRLPLMDGPVHGNWTRIILLAAAALICGCFWEMWNIFSSPKWIYDVPFVHAFQIFEMPILGYFGYLPFGLECAVIGDMILPPDDDQEEYE